MTPARASSLIFPVIVVLAVAFMLSNIYRFITSDDEYDEDDTVTITFNCTQVLGSQNNYPDFVVQQCRQLRANE